jgi:hypothetical protein
VVRCRSMRYMTAGTEVGQESASLPWPRLLAWPRLTAPGFDLVPTAKASPLALSVSCRLTGQRRRLWEFRPQIGKASRDDLACGVQGLPASRDGLT